MLARLGDEVSPRYCTATSGTLVAWSDPEAVWVRWSDGSEERVPADELVVLA